MNLLCEAWKLSLQMTRGPVAVQALKKDSNHHGSCNDAAIWIQEIAI
jgi:hypothetical protein